MNRKEAMKIKPLSILEVKFDNQENEMCILTQKFTHHDNWVEISLSNGDTEMIDPKQIIKIIGQLHLNKSFPFITG